MCSTQRYGGTTLTTNGSFKQCPVCGAETAFDWGDVNGFPMRRCLPCKPINVVSFKSDEVLSKAYEKDYYSCGLASLSRDYDDYM